MWIAGNKIYKTTASRNINQCRILSASSLKSLIRFAIYCWEDEKGKKIPPKELTEWVNKFFIDHEEVITAHKKEDDQ